MQLKVLSVTRTQNLGSNINGKEFVLHKPLKCENIMKLKDSFILWYKYIKFLRISTYPAIPIIVVQYSSELHCPP